MTSDFLCRYLYDVDDIQEMTGFSREAILFDIMMDVPDLDLSLHQGSGGGLFSPWQVFSYYVKKGFHPTCVGILDDMLDELSDGGLEEEVVFRASHVHNLNALPLCHSGLPCAPVVNDLANAVFTSNFDPKVESRMTDFLKRLYAFETRGSWEAMISNLFVTINSRSAP